MRKAPCESTALVAHNACGNDDLIAGKSRIRDEIIYPFFDTCAQSRVTYLIEAINEYQSLACCQGVFDEWCKAPGFVSQILVEAVHSAILQGLTKLDGPDAERKASSGFLSNKFCSARGGCPRNVTCKS